jgi:glutaminyl-peptide cyclotransferase
MSNGSDQIVYRDPATFEVARTLDVRDGDMPIANLNELEYIDGVIWANVWLTNDVARIDAASGKVIGWLNLAALDEEVTATNADVDVLNGIAYVPERGTLLVTGKYWPTLFELELTPEN